MGAKEVRKNLEMLPRVRRLEKPKERCDGIKWNTVALKDIHNHGPNRSESPRGIQERSRCKRKGWWKFKALKPSKKPYGPFPATSGVYCTTHLIMQVMDHEAERRAATKFWDTHGWWKRDGTWQEPITNKKETP